MRIKSFRPMRTVVCLLLVVLMSALPAYAVWSEADYKDLPFLWNTSTPRVYWYDDQSGDLVTSHGVAEDGSIDWQKTSSDLFGLYHAIRLVLPEGKDPSDPQNYYMTIRGVPDAGLGTSNLLTFTGIASEQTSQNYYEFQRMELSLSAETNEPWHAPAGSPLSTVAYLVVPAKRATNELNIGENAGLSQTIQSSYSEAEKQAIRELFPVYEQKILRLKELGDAILSLPTQAIGGYHPHFGITALHKGSVDYVNDASLTSEAKANYFLRDMMTYGYDVHQTEQYINYVLEDIYQSIDQTRILSPEIVSFEVAGSKARIDSDSRTIKLNLLPGTSLTGQAPVLVCGDYSVAECTSGSLADRRLTYKVTPYDPYSGILYNGQQDPKGASGIYSDLSQEWTVFIETGTPYNDMTAFGFYDEDFDKVRYGTISNPEKEGTAGTITLNMPVGTNLSNLSPIMTHLGQQVEIKSINSDNWEAIQNGQFYDFSSTRSVRVVNNTYGLKTEYEVTITSNPSAECEILSFGIDFTEGVINQEEKSIKIEVPYGTALEQAIPEWTISDFAQMAKVPERLEYQQQLSYTVRAENGTEQKYTVIIAETPAATGNSILSFSYGSIAGEFSETQSYIRLKVPYGTDLTKLKPVITASLFAKVVPNSGEAVDFSQGPVEYTVTSQAGESKTYTVEVISADKPTDAPYKMRLETIRANIVASYKSIKAGSDKDGRVVYDDWELMNLGFAECTEKVEPGATLPYGLNIYDQIAELDPAKMTDYARIAMMLTALGIDASKLDQYGDGTAFTDKNGNVITNLVEELYQYNGSYTVNGPIFALIALDMGNYTVPSDAKWTRAALLEEILDHEYGSDGWGIDMVAMLMQSLYPYQQDPTYGARVREKLQLGYDIILGYSSAPGVEPMSSDYGFFAWGATNSESTAQVICALCSMGIDVGTDPNFSDTTNGTGVIPYWLDKFLMGTETGFGHTDNGFNQIATYQSMYALQWYLEFWESGGVGVPYSLYYHRFDFSRPLSKECDITSFVLEGQEGIINGQSITVYVPDGMPLKDLTPELTLSAGAKLLAPDPPMDFVAGTTTTITIQAEDGTTRKEYYVKPVYDGDVLAKGTELKADSIVIYNEDIALKEITGLELTVREDGVTEILITIVPGVDTSKLRFKADLSYLATATIDTTGKENVDLSDWTDVTVTAEDTSCTRQYRIKVVSSEYASISEFAITIDGVEYGAAITAVGDNGTIRFSGIPSTADLTRVIPSKVTLGPGTTELLPSDKVPQNFVEGGEYTVKGEGLLTRTYNVVVGVAGESGGSTNTPVVNTSFAITAFEVEGYEAEIDNAAGIIRLTLPWHINPYQVAPEIETGSGCTVSPVSGQVVNLSSPVVYTLTRGEEKRTYTVILTRQKSPAQIIWDKVAERMDPDDYQVSDDLTVRYEEPEYTPSAGVILSGMRLQVNGDTMSYTTAQVGGALVLTPDGYNAANTYRFRAEKGSLKDLEDNGYSSFSIRAGKLLLGVTSQMDTSRGLDLTLAPSSDSVQKAWKSQNGVVGLWNISCDSVAGGMTFTIDCTGQSGELALVKYNAAKGVFEQVPVKKWLVEGGVLTARNMSPGIYGIVKVS